MTGVSEILRDAGGYITIATVNVISLQRENDFFLMNNITRKRRDWIPFKDVDYICKLSRSLTYALSQVIILTVNAIMRFPG